MAVLTSDMVVSRLVILMAEGSWERAREVFFRDLMHDSSIPDDERNYFANWVGAHDEGERHLLDRDDL